MWDDNAHISQSVRFSPPALHWISDFWTHAYFGLYVPLTYTIWLLVGCATAAAAPIASEGGSFVPAWPFHLVNVATHVAAVLVVWKLLRRLNFAALAAACGAAVFAVHPLQVEPVAWISGFRDVLGGLLVLAAVWQVTFIDVRKHAYAIASILFVAALLAKPSSAAAPLLSAIVLRIFSRLPWRRIVKLMSPWLLLAAVSLLVTKFQQLDALPDANAPLWARPLVAADTLGFYGMKVLWPWPLGIDYGRTPQWLLGVGWKQCLWLVPLAILAGWPRISRDARAALLWIVAAMLPVLGLVTFSFQSYSTVADRYFYVSMAGVAMLAAMAATRWPFVMRGIAAVVVIWAVVSFVQALTWSDTVTLFRHAIAVNDRSFVAPVTLAAVAIDRGNPPLALNYADRSIALNPQFGTARLAAGNALRMMNRFPEAEAAYREVTSLEPKNPAAWSNLGAVLGQQGKVSDAKTAIDRALSLAPESPDAHVNAGDAGAAKRRAGHGDT